MKCLVTRQYSLSLIHQIPAEFVGAACSKLHGHDFKVAVTVAITIDGPDITTPILDKTVEEELLTPYRAEPLEALQDQFTGERLAQEFLKRLRAGRLGNNCVSVQITETRKNRFQALV